MPRVGQLFSTRPTFKLVGAAVPAPLFSFFWDSQRVSCFARSGRAVEKRLRVSVISWNCVWLLVISFRMTTTNVSSAPRTWIGLEVTYE